MPLSSNNMESGENRTMFGAADACRDRLGRFVTVGAYFVPDDPCRTCLCDGGIAVACAVMQCSQPECDHFQRVEGECCSVKCIQTSTNNSIGVSRFTVFSDISDEMSVALRLLASGATFLLLAVVVVYILCQFWRRCLSLFVCQVDCRDGESDGDYLHRREDASSDVCRTDRIDMSVSLPSFDVETPPPPYTPPKLICVIPAYEEAPPPYESMSGSHSSETVASQQNISHSA